MTRRRAKVNTALFAVFGAAFVALGAASLIWFFAAVGVAMWLLALYGFVQVRRAG